jgi:hypothetical protein
VWAGLPADLRCLVLSLAGVSGFVIAFVLAFYVAWGAMFDGDNFDPLLWAFLIAVGAGLTAAWLFGAAARRLSRRLDQP